MLRALDRKRAVPEKLVPVSEMARSLGLPTATVWRWVRAGRVHGVRHGERLTMVNPDEVKAYAVANPPRKGRPKATEAVGEVEG